MLTWGRAIAHTSYVQNSLAQGLCFHDHTKKSREGWFSNVLVESSLNGTLTFLKECGDAGAPSTWKMVSGAFLLRAGTKTVCIASKRPVFVVLKSNWCCQYHFASIPCSTLAQQLMENFCKGNQNSVVFTNLYSFQIWGLNLMPFGGTVVWHAQMLHVGGRADAPCQGGHSASQLQSFSGKHLLNMYCK